MATNLYFSQSVKSEQDLYENIVIESLKMYGQDVFYMPRTLVAEDKIFGEDVASKFEDAYKIEMYLENIDNFDGDQELFTKFGVEIRDRATLHVSRRRWQEVAFDHSSSQVRPNEGDLIYLPLSDQIFEIMRVIDDQPFYQLSNLPTFRMEIELFEYNDEDFDTDIRVIDEIEQNYAYQYILTLTDSSYPNDILQTGTTIQQGLANDVTISGEIAKWNDSSNELSLVHLGADDGKYHLFTTGSITNITEFNDSATYTVISVRENNLIQTTQQNTFFETEGDNIIDFSEGNPFGEVT
jgi:hypothetical protein